MGDFSATPGNPSPDLERGLVRSISPAGEPTALGGSHSQELMQTPRDLGIEPSTLRDVRLENQP